ncbi:MAG: hypothetical protein FWJ87_07890 [Micromonosporaceae bacterium]
MDIHLASLMARWWEVCDITSSCQDYHGRAYVRPTAETAAAAERYLREDLGLEVEAEDGVLWFRLPEQAPPVPAGSASDAPDPDPDLLTHLYRLWDRLAAVRRRLVEVTQGGDSPWMRGARDLTRSAEECLTRAMEAHSYAAGRAVPRADLLLRAAQVVALG